MAPATTPRSLPQSSLLVSYKECARFAQAYLKSFAHGNLKPWAASRQPVMNYSSLVSIRNGKMEKPVPLLINRILEENGFTTQRISVQVSANERATYFQFPDKDKLAEFKRKLKKATTLN